MSTNQSALTGRQRTLVPRPQSFPARTEEGRQIRVALSPRLSASIYDKPEIERNPAAFGRRERYVDKVIRDPDTYLVAPACFVIAILAFLAAYTDLFGPAL